MHPDHTGFIAELHTHFRKLLEEKLTPEQLLLHDYYSLTVPLYDDCSEDFPLADGLPDMDDLEFQLIGQSDDVEY